MRPPKYWIATISKEHALRAVAGSFIQVCHGKEAPLKRMQQGDLLLIYSSKVTMEGQERCQAFTAIGKVFDDAIYPFQMTPTFRPSRRNVDFLPCVETPILPMIETLDFIKNKKAWGYPFRFGFFEISENDFNRITEKMLQHEVSGQSI
jgi:hypothetical protein